MFSASVHHVTKIELDAHTLPDCEPVVLQIKLTVDPKFWSYVQAISCGLTVFCDGIDLDRLEIAVAAFNAAMNHVPVEEPASLEAVG